MKEYIKIAIISCIINVVLIIINNIFVASYIEEQTGVQKYYDERNKITDSIKTINKRKNEEIDKIKKYDKDSSLIIFRELIK